MKSFHRPAACRKAPGRTALCATASVGKFPRASFLPVRARHARSLPPRRLTRPFRARRRSPSLFLLVPATSPPPAGRRHAPLFPPFPLPANDTPLPDMKPVHPWRPAEETSPPGCRNWRAGAEEMTALRRVLASRRCPSGTGKTPAACRRKTGKKKAPLGAGRHFGKTRPAWPNVQ